MRKNEDKRCVAITKSGVRCERTVKKGTLYCYSPHVPTSGFDYSKHYSVHIDDESKMGEVINLFPGLSIIDVDDSDSSDDTKDSNIKSKPKLKSKVKENITAPTPPTNAKRESLIVKESGALEREALAVMNKNQLIIYASKLDKTIPIACKNKKQIIEFITSGKFSVESNKKAIPEDIRQEVWKNRHGINETGSCYCCKREITRDKFTCSHIIAEKHGGKLVTSNLVPTCDTCSSKMGTMYLPEYMLLNNYKFEEYDERYYLSKAMQSIDMLLSKMNIKPTNNKQSMSSRLDYIGSHYNM